MNIYFHGTSKSNLSSILQGGLRVKYGRATFTTNPLYALSFSSAKTWGTTKKLDEGLIIKEGMILVVKDSENKIKVAKESFIIFNKKEKIISGWPNRFKTEQFGYFKRGNVLSKNVVGAYSYDKNFISLLNQIKDKITSGKIDEKYIKGSAMKLEKILKRLQITESKISTPEISNSMVYGMIRNQILREIRTCYLSIFALNGWKIANYGSHPVKLKNKNEIAQIFRNMGRIINKRFISKEIKKEYLRLKVINNSRL